MQCVKCVLNKFGVLFAVVYVCFACGFVCVVCVVCVLHV